MQAADETDDAVDLIAAVQAHVERHLIIATAGGVQLGSGGTDAEGQLGLDVHVHVFERLLPFEAPFGDVCFDFEKTALDGGLLFHSDDAGGKQGFRLRNGAAHIMGIKTPVKRHGLAVSLDKLTGGLRKAAFPHTKGGVDSTGD